MEFPHLAEFDDEFSDDDLVILALAGRGQKEKTVAWMAKTGAEFPVLWADEETVSAYGVEYFPTNVFLDRDGLIIFKTVGFGEGSEDDFRAMIRELIKRPVTHG